MDTTTLTDVIQRVGKSLKPYEESFPKFITLPEEGLQRHEVTDLLERYRTNETGRWDQGYASGTVYHGDAGFNEFLSRVYSGHISTNPLHPDVWPSVAKFEAEIVAMTAGMLGAGDTADQIVGSVSSGGTESILLAMKTYRDWARAEKGMAEPEMIVPTTAHAAFDKAAHYFDMRITKVPVGPDFRADVVATEQALTENTAVVVGSAPPFPHGIIDPIAELSEMARLRGIGFHTDACLGGFLLPWAEKLGYDVPPFDFRLPGVTSISADTHKYGYAAKGTSVVLYRGTDLHHHQFHAVTDWPGGLYITPTLAGSRPGALLAVCWAAMVATGQSGYMEAARQILETAAWIKQEIARIPDIEVIGDPLFVIALQSDSLNIYQVLESMTGKGWVLNGLTLPPSFHLCVTLRQTQPGVKERFIEDLKESVGYVKQHPDAPEGLGVVYGLSSALETRGMAKDILNQLMDFLYQA